jgi:RsiW-degrading membrane proteinase PrsW (M82 family)
MLAAATSAELKGATLTIAYTLESGIISLLAYVLFRDIKVTERFSWLLAGPVLLSFDSIISRTWATSVFNKDFFSLLVLGLTFFGLGLYFMYSVRNTTENSPKQLNVILFIVGSVYAYLLLWLSLHSVLQDNNIAVMISLVTYILIGLVCYFTGLTHNKKVLQLYGALLVGFVVGRLLLIDIWKMALAGRIVTFFLIGALLVSTAFLGKKEKTANVSDRAPQ